MSRGGIRSVEVQNHLQRFKGSRCGQCILRRVLWTRITIDFEIRLVGKARNCLVTLYRAYPVFWRTQVRSSSVPLTVWSSSSGGCFVCTQTITLSLFLCVWHLWRGVKGKKAPDWLWQEKGRKHPICWGNGNYGFRLVVKGERKDPDWLIQYVCSFWSRSFG